MLSESVKLMTTILLWCLMFMILIRIISGSDVNDERLQLHPNETTVFVGDSVILYCSKEVDAPTPVDWYHIPAGMRNKIHIYKSAIDEFYITEAGVNYQTYLSVDNNVSTGMYNLLIRKVLVVYAGTYLCVDTEVDQTTKRSELIVIDRPPVCQHNITGDGAMGENSCNLPLDYIRFNCLVYYHGNVAPMLEVWKGESNSTNKTSIANQIRYDSDMSFVVNASLDLNGTRFYCEILHNVESSHPNDTSYYGCNSSTVKILYAMNSSEFHDLVVQREGSSSCLVNTNSSLCKYKWTNREGSRETFIYSRDLLHNDSSLIGSYRCLAECYINERYCQLEGQLVEFVLNIEVMELVNWKTYTFVFLGLFVGLIFIWLFRFICKFIIPKIHKILNRLRKRQLDNESPLGDIQPVASDCDTIDNTGIAFESTHNLEKESLIQGSQPTIPNPPEGPLHVWDMNDGNVELSWNPPAYDGSRQLIGYLVEQNFEETKWVGIDETISPDVVKFKVFSLQGDKSYQFRIAAKYDRDISESLETNEPIRIKIARSMYLIGQMETKEKKSREVCGLTWFSGTMYVLCIEPAKIFAFSGVTPFDRVEELEIDIHEVKYPFEMTSIAHPKCLFISDYSENQCLWKISIESRSLTSWPVDGRPRSLSTTSKDNLLVIVEKELSKNTSRFYLDIYSSMKSDQQLSRIPLEPTTKNPLNPVETSNGHFMFIHSSKAQSRTSQLIEMTPKGTTVRKLMFECQPASFAIRDDKHIFLADSIGDRVLLLNLVTSECQTVLTAENIDGPCRLCYISGKKQLFVGQLRHPLVLIFGSKLRCASLDSDTTARVSNWNGQPHSAPII